MSIETFDLIKAVILHVCCSGVLFRVFSFALVRFFPTLFASFQMIEHDSCLFYLYTTVESNHAVLGFVPCSSYVSVFAPVGVLYVVVFFCRSSLQSVFQAFVFRLVK